jgi:hypothetical protein
VNNGTPNNRYRPISDEEIARAKQKRFFSKPLRRVIALFVLLFAFSVILYGTQSFLSGRGLSLGNLTRLFTGRSEGVASSDINLRPESNAKKEAIGLVPKDSRLRIVNSTDNWYEIDVIEYGRPKQNPDDADHGWVNKQYVDLR